MLRKSLAFTLIFAFATPLFAQVESKADPAELRKETVAFLRETMADVQNMRTLENRISFSSELARLMWYHDEQEAKTMFNAAISDFRELIARLDAQMMLMPEEAESETPSRMPPFMDGSDRRKFEMKYRVAMAVRQQIATSIAEHDPDVALNFFYDTASTNPKTASMDRDSSLELRLLKEIAAKNPSKAAQHVGRSLDKGLDYQHVDLLKQIYDKNPDVAVEFGAALLKKATDTKFKPNELYTLGTLLDFGSEKLEASRKPGAKKPVYSQADMRELAEAMARNILDSPYPDSGRGWVSTIQKYAPARATQLRAKFGSAEPRKSSNTTEVFANGVRAPDYSGPVSTVGYGTAAANSNTNSRWQQEQDAKRLAEEKLMSDVHKIGKSELPKEEREKVIAESRKILMQTRGKDKQIMGLSMLASQVAKADKELAAEIMRDAEALVDPNPKNYQDFMYTWMLASGYAEADPDKAFPILESAIGRANDLIQAFVKVGEFIDVTEEMISDGEAQVGAFGGGMIRGLSKELGVAEATIATLVKADFAKTKALTNRFERPEVRLLAKMLVLRSALGKRPQASAEEHVRKVMAEN